MGESLTQRRRVGDEGLRIVNPFREGRWDGQPFGRYLQKQPRLTSCQQPRLYEGGKRCSDLLGVKGA